MTVAVTVIAVAVCLSVGHGHGHDLWDGTPLQPVSEDEFINPLTLSLVIRLAIINLLEYYIGMSRDPGLNLIAGPSYKYLLKYNYFLNAA